MKEISRASSPLADGTFVNIEDNFTKIIILLSVCQSHVSEIPNQLCEYLLCFLCDFYLHQQQRNMLTFTVTMTAKQANLLINYLKLGQV